MFKYNLDTTSCGEGKMNFEKTFAIIGIIITGLTLILLIFALFNNLDKFKAEKILKKTLTEDENYCCSYEIDENKTGVTVGYDCTPINKVTKGIKKCTGMYSIVLNKINNIWTINQTSKTIMW